MVCSKRFLMKFRSGSSRSVENETENHTEASVPNPAGAIAQMTVEKTESVKTEWR